MRKWISAAKTAFSFVFGSRARPSDTARVDAALAALANARRAAAERHGAAAPRAASGAGGAQTAPSALTATASGLEGQRVQETAALGDAASSQVSGAELSAQAAAAFKRKDLKQASLLWLAAAQRRDLTAVFHVALCCADGVGAIPRNPAKAAEILERLARVGHSWSQFVLGALLIRGHIEAATGGQALSGLPLAVTQIPAPERSDNEDLKRAFSLLMQAGQSASPPPPAAWLLHCCFEHGVGTPADAAQALAWLRRAAAGGDPVAAYVLAARLFNGTHGCRRDPAAAVGLWRSAAAHGHIAAMHNLGVAYLRGSGGGTGTSNSSEGTASTGFGGDGAPAASSETALPPLSEVARDHPAALVWFSRAGDAGLVRSMVNAGRLLEHGSEGVARDQRVALARYDAARAELLRRLGPSGAGAAGSPEAAALADVTRRRDTLLSRMRGRDSGINRSSQGRRGGVLPEQSSAGAASTADIPSSAELGSNAESTAAAAAAAEAADAALEVLFESPEARDAALQSLLQRSEDGSGGGMALSSVLESVQGWQKAPEGEASAQGVRVRVSPGFAARSDVPIGPDKKKE
jgi:TPR repeat protein